MKRLQAVKLGMLLLSLLLLSGCIGTRVRVTVPPNAPVEGIKTIAVLDLVNATVDPGLAIDFADELSRAAQDSGRYTVRDRVASAAILAKNDIETAEASNPETAVELGRLLEADALVTGEITYYQEDVSVDPPYRVGQTSEGTSPKWYSGLTTRVYISAKVRLIDTSTGAIIWSKRVSESAETGDSVQLSWFFDDAPPSSLLPRPNKRNVPDMREAALESVVRSFLTDLLPGYRYEWRKDEPEESKEESGQPS